MSGGSHDYLYCKEGYELFATYNMVELEDMETELMQLGYDDVARDFRRLIEYIKSARNRVEVLAEMLNPIMHDVEWYCSGDIGKDTLAKTIEEYREGDMRDEDKTVKLYCGSCRHFEVDSRFSTDWCKEHQESKNSYEEACNDFLGKDAVQFEECLQGACLD